jgi:hypothetical protein
MDLGLSDRYDIGQVFYDSLVCENIYTGVSYGDDKFLCYDSETKVGGNPTISSDDALTMRWS